MNKVAMLDTETFGLHPDSIVTQIAIYIDDLDSDTVEGAHSLVWYPNIVDEQASRICDPSTALWWMQQSPQARQAVLRPELNNTARVTKEFVHQDIGHALKLHGVTAIYAAPAMFDFPLMRSYFSQKGPWSFRIERDATTLFKLYDPAGKLKPDSNPVLEHDAQYDAYWQMAYLKAVYQAAGGFKL